MQLRHRSLLWHERWTASARWACAVGVLLVLVSLRREVFPADWPYVFLPYAVGVPVVYVLFGRWPGIAFLAASGIAALLTTGEHGGLSLRTVFGYVLYLLQGGISCWMIDLLQVAMRSLRAEEQRKAEIARDLDDLYQHAPSAYCSLDLEGRFIKVNDTFCDWLGVPATELVGRRTPLDFLTPEGAAQFRTDFPRFKQQGSARNLEYEMLCSNGTRRWVVVDSNAVCDANGRFLHSRTVLTDITARKSAEAEVRRLNAELEHRVRERTEESRRKTEELESFAYSLSHDLRAPIRSINAAASILLEEQGRSSAAEQRDGLLRIRSSSERMAQLMDALLALSALSAPAAPLLPFSHAALVQDAVDNLLPADSPRRAEIRVHDLPMGEGNARRVQRVWENLLSNALKFTAHTPQPRIEVGVDADGQSFYVRDNGVGFDMRYADKILKPFERAHDGNQFEGAGIGLAIADRVVRRDGGRIWYESSPGQGASFHFTLQGPEAKTP